MIEYSQAKITHVSAHVVGNGVNGEKLKLSSEPLEIEDDNMQTLLLTYFLGNFKSPEYNSFTSEADKFKDNPIFKFASGIFSNAQSFHKNSIQIANHLYNVTLVPTIRSGELFVAYLSDIRIEQTRVDAIGIFKCESKESYLKLNTSSGDFKLKADAGINVSNLDKGCLILNAEKEKGFKVLAIDTRNKPEAQFWMNDFLMIKPSAGSFSHTQDFMNLTRQYVDDQLDEEFKVSKADKIDLLNRSMNFFKTKDQFDHRDFEAEVLEDPSVIESFRNYERSLTGREEDIVDNFEISAHAVKRQARIFKSVLKLDKNFHIYIHGNRQLIEKGFDETVNKHYYKIYFDQES